MIERIEKLTELTLNGEMFVDIVKTDFDREDLFLSKSKMEVKRICEYILNQQPKITKYSKMTGFFRFDGSVVGDAFGRSGHKATQEAMNLFYLKSVDNLSTMEWQHATADYKKVLEKGFAGIIEDIEKSLSMHTKAEEIEFLEGLKKVAYAVIAWAEKCSAKVLKKKNAEKILKSCQRHFCVFRKTSQAIFMRLYFRFSYASALTPTVWEHLTDI